MRTLYQISLFLFVTVLSYGQTSQQGLIPQFKGGDEALFNYIASETQFSADSVDQNNLVIVYTKFLVRKDGSLDSIFILQSPDTLLTQEAIRIIKSTKGMWIPARKDNQPIDAMYNLSIKFPSAGDKMTELYIMKDWSLLEGQDIELVKGPRPLFIHEDGDFPIWLQKNLIHTTRNPDRQMIKGQTRIKFTVTADTSVKHIEVIYSDHPILAYNAIMTIAKSEPYWLPGSIAGTPIESTIMYTINWGVIEMNYVFGSTSYRSEGYASAEFDLKSAMKYYNKGVKKFQEGNYSKAETWFKVALQYDPLDLDSRYNLVVALIKQEKIKEACENLEILNFLGGDDGGLHKSYCQ